MLRFFALVCAATVLLSEQVFAQTRYTVTPVANPGTGEFSTAKAINDEGQIAGTNGYTDAPAYAGCYFLSGGSETTLFNAGLLHQSCGISGINNSGQIVGVLSVVIQGASVNEGWVQGVGTILAPVNGLYPAPNAINNLGDIVGRIGTTGFVQSQGAFQILPSNSVAYGINDQRLIVGETDTCQPGAPSCVNARHGFIYNPATAAVTDLGTLGGTNSRAITINNAGQVAGTSDLAGGAGSHAFLYQNGVMTDLGSLSGNSVPTAINSSGQIVGSFFTVNMGVPSVGRAFLYTNGVMRDLNDLIPAGSGWTLTNANGISSSGQIVGTGVLNGQQLGFLLTPVSTGLTSLGGHFTGSPEIGVNVDGRLEAFIRGNDNALYHAWQVSPGGAWSGWESLGGFITDVPAVTVDNAGRLIAFVEAPDHSLWYRSQNIAGTDNWSDWNGLGGVLGSAPAAAVNADGRVDVMVIGTDGGIWEIVQNSPGGSWGPWHTLGGQSRNPAVLARDAAGRLTVFVVGLDQGLWYNTQTAANGSWQGWRSLGGVLTGLPAAVANGAGLLEVYVHGADNALWWAAQTSTSGTWSGWSSRGGVIAGAAAAGLNADGRVELFAIGSDAGLWHITQLAGGGATPWATLGGVLNPPPAVARNANNTLAVLATGTNGEVYYASQIAPGVWP
jgi:probable HAF family extracellular repeat protein